MCTKSDISKKEACLRNVLRRNPDKLKLNFSLEGWVNTVELLKNLKLYNPSFTINDIYKIMEQTGTEYSFRCGTKFIRANYGHSLGLSLENLVGVPSIPTMPLYHGTTTSCIQQIQKYGILPMKRDHVFLTTIKENAYMYGFRHGRPVVLTILSSKCITKGYNFYHPCSHIWLSYHIPANCIDFTNYKTLEAVYE